MKIYSTVLLLFLGTFCFAQSVINNYKYVIVPKQFENFRSENQYKTSTMVKFYLSKQGINAFYDDALPLELDSDRCLALYTKLDDQSNMFSTKVAIVFEDCKGVEQFRTQLGSSKTKQYVDAYREAISESFNSLSNFQYTYARVEDNTPVILNFKDDVKKLPPPTPPAVETKPEAVEDTAESTQEPQDKEESGLLPMPEEQTEAVTLQDAVAEVAEDEPVFLGALYAQKTETGFQLVDTTPSIQFYLKETSLPNVFVAERKGQTGLLFLRDDIWIFEFYQGADRIQEELQIKF